MAEYWSNDDRGYRLRLWVDQVSQNIDGNSSQVRVRLSLHNGLYSFAQYDCRASVTVDGQTQNWSGRPDMLQFNSMIWLIDHTFTVGHNPDGTKSFGFSAKFSGSGGWSPAPGSLSLSGNFSLTTIPRASGITVGNCIIGSSTTITIQRAANNFTHTIRFAWGRKSGTIASNIGTSAVWYIPLNFAEDIPNNVSGRGTIYVDTYSNGRKIGEKSVTFEASLPDNQRPYLSSISLVDRNTTAAQLITGNTFIQIISDIAVSFNGAVGVYGSSIKSFHAEVLGKKVSIDGNGKSFGPLDFSGEAKIRAWVVDSRGRSSLPKEVNITLLPYFVPSISIQVYRTRQNPSTIQVTRTLAFAPLMFNGKQMNTGTLKFKVAPINTTNYTEDNGPASATWSTLSSLTNSSANLAGNYPSSKSFVVVAELKDKFTQNAIQASATVSTEAVIHAYDRNGRLGVGKIPENGKYGSVDIAGDYYSEGKMIQKHQVTQPDGRALRVAGDWNEHLNSGMYMGYSLKNSPFNDKSWQFVEVFKHLDSWVTQVAYQFEGNYMAVRAKTNNTWRNWKKVAFEDNPGLINTGWKEASYAGSYYKRVGDVLTIKYDFRGNGNTITFATIPADIFTAPQAYMLVIAKWSLGGSDNTHVQINKGTNNLHALGTHNGGIYQGQLTIML